MSRKQFTATLLALGSLTLGAAAYAPHSTTMKSLARKHAYVAPCSTDPFPAQNAAAPATQAEAHPVPSEDVIARGHSGS